jgi:hypothetical protein
MYEDYQLPFFDVVQPDPSIEEMKKVRINSVEVISSNSYIFDFHRLFAPITSVQ